MSVWCWELGSPANWATSFLLPEPLFSASTVEHMPASQNYHLVAFLNSIKTNCANYIFVCLLFYNFIAKSDFVYILLIKRKDRVHFVR